MENPNCCQVHAPVPTIQRDGQLWVILNSGYAMPMVGFGTSRIPEQTLRNAIRTAILAGYRCIDTAYWYENEEVIGDELEAIFKEGIVKREDLFITTKLHPSFMGREDVIPLLKKQLQLLKMTYVDLYLIHWPFAFVKDFTIDASGRTQPADPITGKAKFDYSKHYTETWKGMEDAVRAGLARSVGISNFNKRQVEDILLRATIRPAVNQIETHPLLANRDLIEYCQTHYIAVTSHSSLGSPGKALPIKAAVYPDLINDERLKAIAAKYMGKNTAHIMLRWQIQRGVAIIPKSVSPQRILSNLNVFDFMLQPEDCDAILSMDQELRVTAALECSSGRDYPFDELRE